MAKSLHRMSGVQKGMRKAPQTLPGLVGGTPLAPDMKLIDKVLVVERDRFRLTLYNLPDPDAAQYLVHGRWPIAVGMVGHRTPRGLYRINSRAKDPDWYMPREDWVPEDQWGTVVPGGDPRNPIKARWLGITEPAQGIGIHGTDDEDSLREESSHGCVRMRVDDVIELYPEVSLGCPVYIV